MDGMREPDWLTEWVKLFVGVPLWIFGWIVAGRLVWKLWPLGWVKVVAAWAWLWS